jgi:hypothetical protein
MDDITIGVTEFVNNISVSAQPNDQIIDIAVTETVETVLLDVSTTVEEVTVTATQNVIVENITVDYVNNENNIDINVTDGTQDVTLNITPTLVEINILRSGGEVNILQFNTLADFPATGSSDYFYLAKDTNKLYRWTSSAYAEISATANAVWGQIIGTLSEQTDLQNALNLKAPINSPTFTGTVSGITKAMVGLAQVDNTSDLDKPISTATQTALNAKQPLDADLTSIAALSGTFGLLKKTANNSYTIDTNTYLTEITSTDVTDALGFTPENAANKGVNNGYASLDGGGKVPSSQLPSYVDDVIEVANYGSLPSTGETGKIYITLDTNKIYRWTGSVYVEVSSSAAVWGGITGTLSNQTDLQSALNAKQDDLNGTGFVKASGTTISYDNTTYYPASNPNGYTTNTGTVASVALTVPSAFSVSGSPITSSGTLAVTATGNTTQYIAGDGSLVTFPTMSTAGTLIREVRNTTGATLTKGTVVYISGATGNKPTVSKALATGDSTSAQTFGLVQANIANNANGNVVCVGDLTGLDTSAFTEGAQLYLSSTTAGTYTTTKQLAPNHLVYIGVVTRAHPTQGQIEVKIQNGYELDELHNVAAQTPSNNDGLFYESSTSLWKNKSISTVLGYAPANGADYVPVSGDQSISGIKNFTGFVEFENGVYIKQGTGLSAIAGYNLIDADTTGIYLTLPNLTSNVHLNLSNVTAQRDIYLPNSSGTLALTSDLHNAVTIGTANGLSLSTQVLSLGLASTSTTGALSSTDWNTFNGKQAALSGTGFVKISGSTISYDNSTYLTTSSAASTYQTILTNPVTGTGTTNYLPKFTGTSAIGNSLLYDTGSALLVGATSASDAQSKLELVSASTVGLKIISSGANGNNTFLSIQSSKEWRFLTNRGDLIGGNQGDLIIRNNTDGINHIILNQGGSTTFAGALSGTSATFSSGLNLNRASAGNANGIALQTAGTSNWYVGSSAVGANTDLQFYNHAAAAVVFNIANTTGAATFSSSVTATQGVFNGSSGNDLLYLDGGINTDYAFKVTGAADDILTLRRQHATVGARDIISFAYSGNVGIGTTSPGVKLSVFTSGQSFTSTTITYSSGSSQGFLLDNSAGTSQSGNAIWFANSGLYSAISSTRVDTGTWGTDLRFYTHPDAITNQFDVTERMRITSGGNVLVGTTSATASVFSFQVGNGTADNRAFFNPNNPYSIGLANGASSAWYIGINAQTAANGLQFYSNELGGPAMTITTAGNLLVGSATAAYAATNRKVFEVNGATSSLIALKSGDVKQGYFFVTSNGGDMYFTKDTGTNSFIFQNQSNGVYMTVGATGWSSISDIRLKNINSNIENAVDSLMTLKAINYSWKSDEDKKENLGLIAQEVEKIFPQIISKSKFKGNNASNINDDDTEYLSVRYTELVPVLVKAIQELNQKIKTLENK